MSTPRAVEPTPSPEPIPVREEPRPQTQQPAPQIQREPKPIDAIDEENDDDWGAVPAFLRRSKLK